jgi:hypothetical protein
MAKVYETQSPPYILTYESTFSNESTLQLSHKGVETLLNVYKTESSNIKRKRGKGKVTTTVLSVCPCHWLTLLRTLTLLVPFSSVDHHRQSRCPC